MHREREHAREERRERDFPSRQAGRAVNCRSPCVDNGPVSREDLSRPPRSGGGALRNLFARRDDPYAGNDLNNARRLGGVAWLMWGAAALVMLPLAPPHRLGGFGWLLAAAIVLHAIATGYLWLSGPRPGFDGLLAGSYVAIAEIAALQALAGSGADAYQELYLLIAVYTAAVHPPRRAAPFLGALCLTVALHPLYHGWTWAHAADLGVRLIIWLAMAALAQALLATLRAQRQALKVETEHANRLAREDSLTGLGNRRRLMADLGERFPFDEGRPAMLAVFDLDGFKAYNDAYGHGAGDALLRRLAAKLAASLESYPYRNCAYRMGGDEFCLLADADAETASPLVRQAADALSEHGEGFSVTCSYGWVLLPDNEAPHTSAALRLADRRMYAQKNLGRASAGQQSTDVLVRLLAERSSEMGVHMEGVASLCAQVARRLGLEVDSLGPLTQAASLHDIGKAAIPDAILAKPGPLTESDWIFMRNHTLIGERILSAAPALQEAARLVRASHEHFDGNGYPDRLSGDEIPLGARIIAVCDAFDAMTSDRPYRAAMSVEAALDEIRRCAGTQFDPRAVQALTSVVRERELV
jgi:diguanylate cyclase (GGDEF)-like protein